MNRSLSLLLLAMLLIMGSFSCVAPGKVKRSGYLLNKNTIKTENKTLSTDEITGFIQQRPNKKVLGFFRLNTFIFERSKWSFLKNKLGSAPVILDTTMANHSVKQISMYMGSKGYFHAEVSKKIKYRKRSANVTYYIRSGKPYTIRNLSYSINDPTLRNFVFEDTVSSLVKQGSNYDAYAFDNERTRITNHLRNRGYYYFNRDYIFFKVDSSLNTKQMDVLIEFQKPHIRNEATGTNEETEHLRYKINHINFNTDFRLTMDEYIPADTLVLPQYPNDTLSPYLFRYIYLEKLRLSPQLLNRQMFTKGGQFYHLSNFNLTHNRLSNLGITRFVNINFEPVSGKTADGFGLLDCNIQIGRSNSQVFTVEAEGTNTGGFLGTGSNLVYSNRNLFRGGEVFSLKLNGSVEVQRSIGDGGNNFLGFNTIETGIEARLEMPKLLIPEISIKFSKYANPRTSFITGLHYQKRPDYTRYIANISFGYEWRETIAKTHLIVPLELNSVRIFRTNEFTEWLNGLNDKRLINQYTNHLVPLFRYVFMFNNQPLRKNRNFVFLRIGAENSGTLLHLVDKAVDAPKNELDYYTLFGIRYAQFLRLESDFRYYFVLNQKNNIVLRMGAGVGKPFGNSDVLPVEKGFYAGGANGMRGWEIRSLGPGSFNDPGNVYDKMGELWLEGNAEYRFPMYNWLHGALFVDAGNIWMLKPRVDLPGAEFTFSEFIDQIAMDSGFGIRLDLSFFIFRLDGAVKLRNPADPPDDRWIDFSKFNLRQVVWNFGIGYPF